MTKAVGIFWALLLCPWAAQGEDVGGSYSPPTPPVGRESSAAPAPVYRVGGPGPAGGLIFYDKGGFSDGWRYLEAAPPEAEKQLGWSGRQIRIDGTQASIGSGPGNTRLILEGFGRIAGEGDHAARYCDELILNGFDDWFLPSLDELNRMYEQLKRRDLGDFKPRWYWSSTFVYSYSYGIIAIIRFEDGRVSEESALNSPYYVRPIRAF
ncbi:MAG: DUF1566 domain-containing protein [Spirochaetales bacterium]|nr:DUF1566 domain-containing protein [Spirochaetales bacterium]